MTRITDSWVNDAPSKMVFDLLINHGHQAYFVGGCVRNALLGAPVADLDVCTDARPETVVSLAESAGIKSIPTGIDHGTVTLIAGGRPYEVTTFRRDVETDGRRAVVAFANDIADDARRRDFTMNALYAGRDGKVSDPVGTGIADLNARHVRFIDDANQRIREDYLRILRFFRFFAWYGDQSAGLNPDGLAACAQNSDGIETLSHERLGAEMKKLLSAPSPSQAVASMAQSGVLARVLPGSDARALPVLEHLEHDTYPDAIRRLAVLGGQDVPEQLRLSRAEARQLQTVRDAATNLTSAAGLAQLHGADTARDALLVRAALMEQPLPDNWQANLKRGADAEFPLSPADLMPEYQGAALGDALKRVKNAWVESDLTLSRADLLNLLAQ